MWIPPNYFLLMSVKGAVFCIPHKVTIFVKDNESLLHSLKGNRFKMGETILFHLSFLVVHVQANFRSWKVRIPSPLPPRTFWIIMLALSQLLMAQFPHITTKTFQQPLKYLRADCCLHSQKITIFQELSFMKKLMSLPNPKVQLI